MNDYAQLRMDICDELDMDDAADDEDQMVDFEETDLDLSDASDNQTVLD